MATLSAAKITPCLWFAGNAAEAARFYTAIFPASSIDKVQTAPGDTPGNKEGEVLIVLFTLAGCRFQALNGPPADTFNNAVSFSVDCADQAEVDHYWDALLADGGQPIACGWLKDRFGLSWQIVPRRLPELIADPDPARAKRALDAMMEMVKIDIAAIEAAAGG